MRTLCKHIFASAGRKFNTVIPSLGDTLTLMQECFKNIRDVDKKIRLLEFYVFGNVTVTDLKRFFADITEIQNLCLVVNWGKSVVIISTLYRLCFARNTDRTHAQIKATRKGPFSV